MKLNISEYKKLMKQQGLTQSKLVKKFDNLGVKIKLETIKSWTRTIPNNPSLGNILTMSEIFMVNPNSLILNGKLKEYISVKKVPIVGISSCGRPTSNDSQENDRFANYNGEYWNKDLYCVIACGDSMAPEIEDGDEVICDPNANLVNGCMVHYTIDNESAIKIYVKDENAFLVHFIPYNKSEDFKIRTIRLDDDIINVKIAKVVSVNKLKLNNNLSRLKAIGWA